MNGRYIDFVPVKVKRPAVKESLEKELTVELPEIKMSASERVASEAEVFYEEVRVREKDKETERNTFSLKNEPKYGVIEDLKPKFVNTEVSKRPLHRECSSNEDSDLKRLKAERIAAWGTEKLVEKSMAKDGDIKDASKMKIPESPFINHAKVTKRPLSKNVYERKIEPTKEENSGPVTIITKPEKDTKVGLVVTIILTIILGAAAGTIAFLILPK